MSEKQARCSYSSLITRHLSLVTKKGSLDEVADDVADEVVRLLYALRVFALDDEGEVAQTPHAAPVAAEQADDRHAALARRGRRRLDVGRVARGRDGQQHVAARAERLDLPGEDALEARVVGDAGQHAAVGRQRERGQGAPALQEELVHELARDVLSVGRGAAVAAHQELAA